MWSLCWAGRLVPPDFSQVETTTRTVNDHDDDLLGAFITPDGMWHYRAEPHDVDPLYLAMLKMWEAQRYDDHLGFDPLAMTCALGQWAQAGCIVSGASTLTMQTARLLEPSGRTLGTKLTEMAHPFQLERRYGKYKILSVYLTLTPFGGNLEGVRAASLAYFSKEPDHVTLTEAALLVALPLRTDGGTQPYLWLVNDLPVDAYHHGEADWVPDGARFVSVSVSDAADNSASADVFVKVVGRD